MNWEEFDAETRALAEKIDFKPETIAMVVRGGLFPGGLLAKILNVTDVVALRMKRDGKRRIISAELPAMNGRKILLVEDMIETGRSLIEGKKFLEECGAEVRTACLYTMPISEIRPDYFLREIPEIADFPWNL